MARKRAAGKIGWYKHLALYLAVNTVLLVMSIWHGKTWGLFPLFGWGIGLTLHGLSVWYAGHGSEWRNRLIEKERQTLLKQTSSAPRNAPDQL